MASSHQQRMQRLFAVVTIAIVLANVCGVSSSNVVTTNTANRTNTISIDRNSLLAAETNNTLTTSGNVESHPDRFPVIVEDFARVETPFIISLWIFCACLGKIGEKV